MIFLSIGLNSICNPSSLSLVHGPKSAFRRTIEGQDTRHANQRDNRHWSAAAWSSWASGVALRQVPEIKIVGVEMTKHIAPLPDHDGSLLLRELNHRVNNELTSTICTISAKAVASDDVAVKAALLDVVDLLHGYADVHQALRMPDPGRLTDAASYLQHLCFSIAKYRLDRLSIRLLCSLDDLRLRANAAGSLG
jgi:two-component sensor histidine kinase